MQLPGAARAVVDPRKVRDYLLSYDHPVGRHKAAVFEWLGYRRENWARLYSDLVRAASADGAVPQRSTRFGQTFRLPVMLQGPLGRVASLNTVWIVESGTDYPRFVTAYPGG